MSGKEENFGDKKNSNGFKDNPENINTKGRPISIRATLREILGKKGKLFIPKEQIIHYDKKKGVTISVPDEMHLALKLKEWAFSTKGYDSLKAIQMIMEHIDGKPSQSIEIDPGLEGIITIFRIPDNGRD